tara:strand:- start:1019 stop:2032 length:1014 start_codon:yes stop_codon:yes gene_type:complete
MRKRLVIICPGRGSYTRETSGYLAVSSKLAKDHISWIDDQRKSVKMSTLTDLDTQPFKAKIHMIGENASPLIYACSLSDFLSINNEKYEIVAITGNSMGWYIALALGQALNKENAYHLIQTMGSLSSRNLHGGQIIYPIIDDNWQVDKEKEKMVLDKVKKRNAFISIYLGGYLIIGGEQNTLDELLKELPTIDKYPLQLPFHSAFHTPIMENISRLSFSKIPFSFFQKPNIPLIDGRGNIWSPYSTDIKELYNYTLGYQVKKTYNFTSSINVAIKEFCPDKIVLLGPGNTLGGSIGQIIIQSKWLDVTSKTDFIDLQKTDPFLISMDIKKQRNLVCR